MTEQAPTPSSAGYQADADDLARRAARAGNPARRAFLARGALAAALRAAQLKDMGL